MNKTQLYRLSEFVSNLGLIFVGSVVAPIFSGVDEVNVFLVLLGLVLALLCLLVSLWLVKKK